MTFPGVFSASGAQTCDPGSGVVCDAVFRLTDSELVGEVADMVFSKGLRVVLIAGMAWMGTYFANRFIKHLVERIRRLPLVRGSSGILIARAAQRGAIISSVLHSAMACVVWTMAALMILAELGLNLGPLIAGAGIAGVALGFGAQSLVRDFLSGLFILFEDQFAMGDEIELVEVSGTVEGFTLRITKLRDESGKIWYVPNGEIRRVGNKSQTAQEIPSPSEGTGGVA